MRFRAAAVALVLPLSGCVATQRDVLDLHGATDELKLQVSDLRKSVSSMQANQADLAVQMKQLQESLGAYTETVREQQGTMKELSSKIDDFGATVLSRVSSIGQTLSSQQAKTLEEQKASLAKQEAEIASQAGGGATELFQTAQVRLAKKSFDLAAKGFEEYIRKYPKGALIDVAIYDLGEAYFGEKRWEDAGRQFALVLEKYPKSEMTPSARLMYALSLVNMKKNLAEARQYLESVAADFPNSPEARAAANHLKKLSGKKGQL